MAASRYLSEKDAWACVNLVESGKSVTEAAKFIGRDKSTVSRALQRYRTFGTPIKQPKNYPKLATNQEVVDEIVTYAKWHPFDKPKQIKERLKLGASISTIKRRLKENGLLAYRPAKKPRLTEEHKEFRLEWSHDYQHFDWGNVVFSDEVVVCTSDHGLQWVRRPRGERFNDNYVEANTRSGRTSISCWGFMWRDGFLDLDIVPNTMNGPTYRDLILKKRVVPFMHNHPELTFMQDNSSVHCSKIVKEYLNEQNIEPLVWPPKSPDCNPIGNAWHILKEIVGPVNHIQNVVILWQVVKNAWEELRTSEEWKDLVPTLYASVPDRLAAVIANNGSHIKY